MKSNKKLRGNGKLFSELAERFRLLKFRYKLNDTQLSLRLGISRGYMGNITSGKVSGKGDALWVAVRREFPEWEEYLRGRNDIPPDKKGPFGDPKAETTDRFDVQTLDLTSYHIVKLIEPEEGQRRRLHLKLDEILDSGNPGLITAIAYNIEEFAKSASEKRKLGAMKAPPSGEDHLRRDPPVEEPSPSSEKKTQ